MCCVSVGCVSVALDASTPLPIGIATQPNAAPLLKSQAAAITALAAAFCNKIGHEPTLCSWKNYCRGFVATSSNTM